MYPRRILVVLLLALACACRDGPGTRSLPERLAYPPAPTVDQVDEYHGVRVADPYRWLENPDSPQTRAWIEEENDLTFRFLEGIPERTEIHARLERLWDYERWGIPQGRGGRYFFTRNEGLENQGVLHVSDSLQGGSRVLLDPNRLSTDGTVALAGFVPSEDGKLLAYGLSSAGSDWTEWWVLDVDRGTRLADHICWVKFSGVSWTPDSKGFFYGRYDEPAPGRELQAVNHFQKLWYHRIGTPQSADALIYSRPDEKEWSFGGEVTEDGAWLIITVRQGTDPRNRVYYKELRGVDALVVKLLDGFDASYDFVGNDGGTFWFLTDLEAPRGRLVAIDTASPDRSRWKEIIPQGPDTLVAVTCVHGIFIAHYLHDAHSIVRLHGLDGALIRELALPCLGSVAGFRGRRKDGEAFFAFTSYTVPQTVYRLDMKSYETTIFRKPEVDFRPADFETRQVFYESKDGTRIPMFLSYKRGLRIDAGTPALLVGYGGFNIPMTPSFSVSNILWMEMGGLHAVANIRGGGEYGEEWHRAGTKLSKQNVFDDFIAAAEWLIHEGYTSPGRLAIHGGSNGGLLVGACLTQRPDLFGAALPAVGVLDMLRFHRFTIGWAWTSDYGSPENPEEFKALLAYSPLHHVRPGTRYPATFITTGDHDDRVVPAHSFKFAAALQAAQAGFAPILIRIETRAGHGAGKPTRMAIEESADRLAFLVKVFGMSLGDLHAGAPRAAVR